MLLPSSTFWSSRRANSSRYRRAGYWFRGTQVDVCLYRLLTVSRSTRHFWRLRSPEIAEKLEVRARGKEALAAAANRAFRSFLEEISENHYALLRDAVNKLAVADCLSSLAVRALEDGYVRPQFSEEDALEIIDGRHPMIEALRDSPFVPNSINMQTRHKVITGPNMGGKSSVVRMVALCAIVSSASTARHPTTL